MATPAVILQADETVWLYANGGESFFDEKNNYFTAWCDMPENGGTIRRQIVCRLVLPLDVAKDIRAQAARDWARGGH